MTPQTEKRLQEIGERAERSLEDPLISRDCYQLSAEDLPWALSLIDSLVRERDEARGVAQLLGGLVRGAGHRKDIVEKWFAIIESWRGALTKEER